MAAAVETHRDGPRDSYRVKRTEALPKHSLFGSALEIQDEQVAQQLEKLDPKTVRVPMTPTPRGPGQRFVLPEDVKENLPGAKIYETSRRKVDNQSEIAKQITADLRKKEEEALYRLTQTGYDDYHPVERNFEQGTSRSQWFTQKDLAGAKEINIVGLNKNQSYNRDKYGQKAPVHNYSLIGDVLRPGMDFPRRERTEVQMRNLGYGKGDLRGILAEGTRSPPPRINQSARTPRHASINLPPNIKHKYGSRVCDNLLADRDVVEKTIQKENDFKASIQRKSQPIEVPKFNKELNPEYEMLGNSLRMNVTPGYTMDHKISTTKTSFNDQVHLLRHPDPDKWRYQKDELSTWSQHQVLWNRVAKSWKDYFKSQPTITVRSAPVRLTTERKEPNKDKKEPKPKQPRRKEPQRKEKQKAGERKNSGFEEFKFETPPVTPPPDQSGKLASTGVKRDDEFWNFYDKGKD